MYRSLLECIIDLEKHGHLIRIQEEVDPRLEMAAIHRRVFAAGGPALLFERVKGSPFPAVSNLFGTLERARFIFRKTLPKVEMMMRMAAHPESALKNPLQTLKVLPAIVDLLPRKVRSAPVLKRRTRVSQLPQLQSWPADGGAFLTLPQVLTLDPDNPSLLKSNLGMYRVQISGNQYQPDEQIGLHYQIHRGIGVHHARALQRGEKLKVSIFLGGPPAHTLAAVMPLPEGMSELSFAGLLAGRRFRYLNYRGWIVSAEADFVILGTMEEELLPEGPFGDHLGYYSLAHDFPVLRVETVFHRPKAIFPFTVVGRPPQEDTIFGKLIHEITAPMIPKSLPGVKAVHAVDESGVHPLLLAIGSERYVPYEQRQPMELLTQAQAILGFGQLSLAKYLLIVAEEDDPQLNINDIQAFFRHLLSRIDLQRDLHFFTETTIDTLDYSGAKLNHGSKVVMAAAGKIKKELGYRLPQNLKLPPDFKNLKRIMPGVLALEAKAFTTYEQAQKEIRVLEEALPLSLADSFPLIVVADDSEFVGASLANFLWVTFTRSNPSHDIYGIGEFVEHKHWGCKGSLIIDARIKPHHAPPLQEDPAVEKRVDELAARGHSLHGVI
ncbi:UbiD family decarboxylase [Caldithrix abyssi DSM 13497]|uniref:4-hydroxy-3-polyprenylbenzoate decarboxylase n=1 Tax=Caldithrix abyssi DSM 13497 TaxID=880073 RepID=H1XSZ1_CALAY|nr:UbiD family decarboxylase [Caldithrix abyssi]APF17299.1 4-hydroxy-3-polyprenylbenzoate decarboxylase [Caldithrix abyssi DSM 13497]EHO41420.1 UbiD family decarboxylase [Caldithrix abyssi DSM 13497]